MYPNFRYVHSVFSFKISGVMENIGLYVCFLGKIPHFHIPPAETFSTMCKKQEVGEKLANDEIVSVFCPARYVKLSTQLCRILDCYRPVLFKCSNTIIDFNIKDPSTDKVLVVMNNLHISIKIRRKIGKVHLGGLLLCVHKKLW